MKTVTWGEGRTAPLDWGTELWKRDVSRYESANGIRAALAGAGLEAPDDNQILYEATRSLINDVIDAAGGVEQAHARFHQALERADQTLSRWADQLGDLREGAGMTDPSVEAAWYALEEMLIWARVMDDRLKRPPIDRRRYTVDQGLVPALADGPRRDAIIQLRAQLLQSGGSEARYLSGLSLHMQSSQAGSKRARIRSGKPVLPFPDRVSGPIGHRWQLQYEQGRDAATFADNLMTAITRFMGGMIATLEEHLPERFRTNHP